MDIIDSYSSAEYTGPAIKIGAGGTGGEALMRASQAGYRVVSGDCPTVGISGGFSTGGGHGLLNGPYGLASENVLEWGVITADGRHLKASPRKNADLYWALTGGGGDTFAVVLSMTARLHPESRIGAATLTFNTSSSPNNETYNSALVAWWRFLPTIIDTGACPAFNFVDGGFNVHNTTAVNKTADDMKELCRPYLEQLDELCVKYTLTAFTTPSYVDHYNYTNGPLPFGPYQSSELFNSRGVPRGIATDEAAARKLTSATQSLVGFDRAAGWQIGCMGLDVNATNIPRHADNAGIDPVEAEALSTAFLGPVGGAKRGTIYTDSIKTVLGHTKGTAGIAAILKGVRAMQSSTVPPNLLFNRLNPAIAPFYGNIQIPTQAHPWPTVCEGQPKRVSVTNFGFGGTNAHAILESYYTESSIPVTNPASACLTPFVFSAGSAESLRSNLSAYAAYMDDQPDTNVSDLAYTLRERRSVLPYCITFSATSLSDLGSKIQTRLTNEPFDSLGVRTWAAMSKKKSPPRIMGVITGQGAQYARMGSEPIRSSPFARRIIGKLDDELQKLPKEDGPNWFITFELLAEPSKSRIGEAAISQPLCTAIQIMLVDILRAADVRFHAVVGHSGGEIAAAYAARFLCARGAIVIACYRGLHCTRASNSNGQGVKGAMLAAGTSPEDATELCEDEEFAGRIGIAAINSSSSVTISGDEDAVAEVEAILEDEKKFNRRLRVDVAYHSKHMIPGYDPYVAFLWRAGVNALPGDGQCTWFSSVFHARPVESGDNLSGAYWAENMTKPVVFSQATQAAAAAAATVVRGDDRPVAALEVGPHPAISGPSLQNIDEALQKKIPYHGTLQRGDDAACALSNCLGFLWMHLGKAAVNLSSCDAALSGYDQQEQRQFASRRSRRIRLCGQTYYQLLGNASPDSAPHLLRWKNVLKPSEMPWLEGHQVQGQVVLPAAAYVSTAVEAARSFAEGRKIRLIELSDFNIHKAITFDEEDASVEIQVELSQLSKNGGQQERATSTSVQDFLPECRSRKGLLQVVKEAYGAQLRKMLQTSIDDDELMMMQGFDLGFDSLLSVDVRSWFLKSFQVSVPVFKIMANDVRMSTLVDLVVDGQCSEPKPNSVGSSSGGDDSNGVLPASTASNVTSSEETSLTESTFENDHKITSSMIVDWTAETTPPDPDISVPDLDSAPAPKTNPEVVVLTGCSGLLGHHLLNALIAQPSIRKIICIAVRHLQERLETKRLPPSGGRVIYHEGDLSQSNFGLREEEWADMFREVDAVIHNRSDTSHLKFYSTLRQANLESTRKLVGACLRRRVPFHYVSSAGVALFAGLEAFPPASCTGTERYPNSGLFPSVRRRLSARATMLRQTRPGLIGSTRCYTTLTDYNAGAFDLVPVETCCDDVVRELLRDAAKGPAKTDKGITFVNSVGDVVIPMMNMSEIGLKTTGRKYSSLPMDQWTKNVVAAGKYLRLFRE
ncbi:hypothetical protein LX32DRAFT_650573 [Colletotrichum zoysiae]|uniref:Carrier domain-containing protein n=1 Tax=Colletotrichum zoysiae TaxID=1216348 RepID=A0AAD9M4H9_9PEZI|nr:hypothetical protein LX32DRAFT_650573 [Colletotrichum zoysiae]